MGCGCNATGGACGGNKDKLRSYRNKIVTLYNTSKDPNKKQEYKEVLNGIDAVSKSSACPDKEFLLEIKNYVEDEYNKLRK